MNYWAKLEKETYKKNQFKAQLVQNRPKGIGIDQIDLIGLLGTKVDIIGPNINCLIFRKNKLSLKIIREQIIHYITNTNLLFIPKRGCVSVTS